MVAAARGEAGFAIDRNRRLCDIAAVLEVRETLVRGRGKERGAEDAVVLLETGDAEMVFVADGRVEAEPRETLDTRPRPDREERGR